MKLRSLKLKWHLLIVFSSMKNIRSNIQFLKLKSNQNYNYEIKMKYKIETFGNVNSRKILKIPVLC